MASLHRGFEGLHLHMCCLFNFEGQVTVQSFDSIGFNRSSQENMCTILVFEPPTVAVFFKFSETGPENGNGVGCGLLRKT
eukprot:1693129-Amphidinium_carterae.1